MASAITDRQDVRKNVRSVPRLSVRPVTARMSALGSKQPFALVGPECRTVVENGPAAFGC